MTTKWHTAFGESRTLAEWSLRFGISRDVIYARLRLGWPVERAVSTPVMTRSQVRAMGGKTAHRKGTAHQFTSEEARAAGRLGGKVASKIPGHMKKIGSLGGRARWAKAKAK